MKTQTISFLKSFQILGFSFVGVGFTAIFTPHEAVALTLTAGNSLSTQPGDSLTIDDSLFINSGDSLTIAPHSSLFVNGSLNIATGSLFSLGGALSVRDSLVVQSPLVILLGDAVSISANSITFADNATITYQPSNSNNSNSAGGSITLNGGLITITPNNSTTVPEPSSSIGLSLFGLSLTFSHLAKNCLKRHPKTEKSLS